MGIKILELIKFFKKIKKLLHSNNILSIFVPFFNILTQNKKKVRDSKILNTAPIAADLKLWYAAAENRRLSYGSSKSCSSLKLDGSLGLQLLEFCSS